MTYNQLLIDIDKIPFDRQGIAENLDRLLSHTKYLEERNDVSEPLARGLLDTAPAFIHKQIDRLLLHLDDEVDIIAWISRNLMELFFMLRYMYSSRERYDEVIKEQLKDLKEIENKIYPNGMPSENATIEVKAFQSDMKKLWEAMQEYGINHKDLKKPLSVVAYATGAGLENEYACLWKIHSKYVHPTSYVLFGKKFFVYGADVSHFFWVIAQYYAARNLGDLHLMIESVPITNNGA